MTNTLKAYRWLLSGLVVVFVVAFSFLFRSFGPSERNAVKLEGLKVGMDLLAIGIAGGFLTWLLGERSKEKERAISEAQRNKAFLEAQTQKARDLEQARDKFRLDAIGRIVIVTNNVRKAPLLIESHRSKKTYGEQMRLLLDARLEISLLRHELISSKIFSGGIEIGSEFRKMEDYLEKLITEWRENYSTLSEDLKIGWPVMELLPALTDLRQGDDKQSSFRSEYLTGYRDALVLMRAEILGPGSIV